MSIDLLNLGSAPNDGTGQDLRSGGQVINDNFSELDTRTASAQDAADAAALGLENKVDKEAGKGLSSNDFTSAEKTKLAGVAGNATANATNAQLRDRSTHTGTQLAATISDLAATVRGTVLDGLSVVTGGAIAAADTILAALGKLQNQITARAMRGANSDITSISGLTTMLPVTQGGTGANAPGAARAALGVDVTLASAILDPASGGLMSSTVVSGFTVSKYANGDMTIYGSLPTVVNVPANSSPNTTATIPSGFISTASLVPSIVVAGNVNADHYGICNVFVQSTTQINFVVRNGATTQSFLPRILVTGRWK